MSTQFKKQQLVFGVPEHLKLFRVHETQDIDKPLRQLVFVAISVRILFILSYRLP